MMEISDVYIQEYTCSVTVNDSSFMRFNAMNDSGAAYLSELLLLHLSTFRLLHHVLFQHPQARTPIVQNESHMAFDFLLHWSPTFPTVSHKTVGVAQTYQLIKPS